MVKTFLTTTVAAAALIGVSFGSAAYAQACDATEFGAKTGQAYLAAENELIQNKNPSAALAKLNELRSMEMNCYERGAMLRLSAAIKIETGNAAGAVTDLEEAIRVGSISGDDVKSTYYTISQIYLQQNDVRKALDYMQRWIRAGGQPDRDQNWQLAVIHNKLDQNKEALPYAEKVLATDGQSAKREVIDFLIFLYDRTGNLSKKADLLERLLRSDPTDRKVWDAISGDYYQANDERKAFEVQKAMYLAGLLKTEDELKRITNFYNRFNAPYEAAKVLEKEINAGRVSKTLDNLELLANLYQVAREYQKAIPVIRQAANMTSDGKMYERLGRSYFELGKYKEAINALTQGLNKGNLKEPGYAWVLIGQSRYELDDRSGARDAFQKATNFRDGSRAGQGWIQFMNAEIETKKQFTIFEARVKLEGIRNEKKVCDQVLSFSTGGRCPD